MPRKADKTDVEKRKIHVDLPREVHRKLKVKAALEEVSLQECVVRMVAESVKNIPLPEIKRKGA